MNKFQGGVGRNIRGDLGQEEGCFKAVFLIVSTAAQE